MQPRVVSFVTKVVSPGEGVVLDIGDEVVSVETTSDTRIMLVIQQTQTNVPVRRTAEGNLVTAVEYEGSW